MIGLQVGTLLAGAILTETIFSWPGIGKWLVEAIHRRDYPVVQGGILMSASVIIGVNLVVDLLYGVINPRIRHATERHGRCSPCRRAPPSPWAELWRDFCRNRGALVGLGIVVALVLSRAVRRRDRAASAERAVPRCDADAAVAGSRSAATSSCSAPIRSAATCCRA